MNTKMTFAAALAVVSISALLSSHAHADELKLCLHVPAAELEQSKAVDQHEVDTPTHAQHFMEMLQSDEELHSKHVFKKGRRSHRIAMTDLRSLQERIKESGQPEIVATKMVGDFSLSIINLAGDEKVGLMMVQGQDGWKFISEFNFEVDGCGRMFDRRQFGAFFTLMMWAEDYGI